MENIPENIKFLILKKNAGTITQEERDILYAWYNEDLPEELYWYGDSEDMLKERLQDNILFRINIPEVVKSRRRLSPVTAWVASVAAMLLIGLFVGFYVMNSSNDQTVMISAETKKDEITKFILPDQTIVWLKGNSKLSYPDTFTGKTREVNLAGEALFEVAKDRSKPFIIHTGDYETKVLGTSFNLKVDPQNGKLDLSVLTGTVEVTKKQKGLVSAKKYLVEANQGLQTDDDLIKPVQPLPVHHLKAVTQHTEYDMNFVSTSVEDIMKRFEEKFDISFEGYTGEYSSCKVTADLTDQSLETSLKLLSLSINASYKIENDKIKLAGGGCF